MANAEYSQYFADNLCLHHELHEYDQDEDSSKASAPRCFAVPRRVYIPKSSGSDLRATG